MYWSHCKLYPRSIDAFVPPKETELQFDSDCPSGIGDKGGSSEATVKLIFTAGVTEGSLQAKLHRFLMILAFGHGSLVIHSSNSLANAFFDWVCNWQKKIEKLRNWYLSDYNLQIFCMLPRWVFKFFYRFTWHFIKEKNDLYWFSTDHIVNVVNVVIFHLFHWIKMSGVKMSVASKHWQTSGKNLPGLWRHQCTLTTTTGLSQAP